MNDSNAEEEGAIIHRKNARTLERESESKLARLAKSKSLRLALATVGAVGALKTMVGQAQGSEDISGQATTTLVQEQNSDVEAEKAQEKDEQKEGLFDTVYHDLSPEQEQEARALVDMFKARIEAKVGWEKEHVDIPMRYKDLIDQTAKAHGLTDKMLQGIISIENGGGIDIENPYSGAVGVAQFLPETARENDLKVDKFIDERKIPEKSIPAAGNYLENHKALFDGDEGITIWSYHAGQGNVYRAMRVYFLDKYHEDIGDYVKARNYQETQKIMENAHRLMRADKLDVFKLLSNEVVKSQVISKLDDYTETYVPQVVALTELLNDTDNEKDTTSSVAIPIKSRP